MFHILKCRGEWDIGLSMNSVFVKRIDCTVELQISKRVCLQDSVENWNIFEPMFVVMKIAFIITRKEIM